jgi:hypothetical protein
MGFSSMVMFSRLQDLTRNPGPVGFAVFSLVGDYHFSRMAHALAEGSRKPLFLGLALRLRECPIYQASHFGSAQWRSATFSHPTALTSVDGLARSRSTSSQTASSILSLSLMMGIAQSQETPTKQDGKAAAQQRSPKRIGTEERPLVISINPNESDKKETDNRAEERKEKADSGRNALTHTPPSASST